MKKMLIALLLIICMLPACAWAEKVTLTYVSNNGTTTVATCELEVGSTHKTLAADFFKAPTGQKFYCWRIQTGGLLEQIDAEMEIDVPHEDTTLFAEWVDKNVTMLAITIAPTDGTLREGVDAVSYAAKGKDMQLPPYAVVVAPEGKQFYGWNVDGVTYPGGGIYENVQTELTLNAVWIAENADIAEVGFRANGGTGSMNAAGIERGTNYTLPACKYTAPEGMRFKCWNVSGTDYAPGDSITVDSNKTIKAVWEELPDCAITFNGNGATAGTMASATVKEGGSYILPWYEYSREGHNFEGWLVNGVLKQPYDTITVSADTEIVASWEAHVYNVHFSAGIGEDGNNSSGVTLEKTYGVGFELEDASAFGFTCKGHNFVGWKDETNGPSENAKQYAVGEEFVTEAFTILVAQWEPKQYKVTFKPGDGTGEMADGVATYGRAYNLPDCTFKAPADGYVFKAWLLNGREVPEGTSLLAESDTEVTALWEKLLYTITFEGNGAAGSIAAVQVEPGAEYTLPSPEGFDEGEVLQFDGWKVKGTQTIYRQGKKITVDGNMTLVAQWKGRKVSLSYQDANGNEVHKVEKEYGQSHTVLTAAEAAELGLTAPAGYQFAGWQLYNNEGGKLKDVTATAGQPLTLYSEWWIRPVWEKIIYTITFDSNGATGTMNAVTVGENDSYKVPANAFTAPKGHHFEGWTLDGTMMEAGKTITVSGNITLKANWAKNIYTVKTLDSNDASSAVSEDKEYGTKITLPACSYTATSEYHSFAYWKVEDEQGVRKMKAGDSVTVESDTVISAIWDFDDSVKTRVEQVDDIANLPPQEKKELEQQMLQEMPPKLQTIEAVVEELADQAQDEGFVAEQTEVHEVKLMFKPADSDEWIEATEENFPTAGIEVRMPLPEGTNAADFEFLVIHMFTTKSDRLGTEPGKTETIVPVIENGELVFTLNGLSPVSVAWKERPVEGKLEAAQLPKTGDASCLMAWITLLGASGAGFAVIGRRKR